MCTRAIWNDAAGAVLVGRNMDYERDTSTNLWAFPQGMSRDDGLGGALAWESKHGSLVAGVYDISSADGLNERGLGGHLLWLAEAEYGPLPGGTDAGHRFARAAYCSARLPKPEDSAEAVAFLLSVMRNAAQPFRLPDADKPEASSTVWRSVTDLTSGTYVFESTRRPNIVWARIGGLDLSEGSPARKLDLTADTGLEGGLAGEVTEGFAEAPPMQFMSAS